MFKTIFCKSIWDGESPESSTYFAILQREEDLPFAPTIGVDIYWGRDMPQAPVRVRWEVLENRFVCNMKDEFPHEIGADEFDFDLLITNAVHGGWTLIAKKAV